MIAHPSAMDLRPESDSIPLHRLSPHPPPAATILRGGRSLSLGRPPPPRATPPLFVVARLGAAQRRLRAQRGSGSGGSGHVEDLQAQRDLERLFQLADINEEAAQSSSAGGGGGGDSGGGDGDGGSSGSGSSQPRREPLQPTAPTSTRGARAPPPPPLSSPGAAPRPQKPYRSPPPPDSISMPFEAFRFQRPRRRRVLKTPSWSSSWHDVLCGGGGEGTGIDGTDELDVDGAIVGGMCCACEFIGPTRVGDAAPVEKELDDGTATDIAITKTSRVGYATRARSPLPTPTDIAVGDAQQQQVRSTVIAYTAAW